MFKRLYSIAIVLVMLQAQNALAHTGGHGPINPETANYIALNAVDQFTEFDPGLGFGMLPGSWKKLSLDSAKIEVEGDGYYIVSVENKTEGKKLYFLISIVGDIYDANFTGDFPKVK